MLGVMAAVKKRWCQPCFTPGTKACRLIDSAPDRADYLTRFEGALVLTPYAREQFASQVSGVVLDALMHGTPVIASKGTWPGNQVERFAAGLTIAERTPGALSAAIDQLLADWQTYADNACNAAKTLTVEHNPSHLMELLTRHMETK